MDVVSEVRAGRGREDKRGKLIRMLSELELLVYSVREVLEDQVWPPINLIFLWLQYANLPTGSCTRRLDMTSGFWRIAWIMRV